MQIILAAFLRATNNHVDNLAFKFLHQLLEFFFGVEMDR